MRVLINNIAATQIFYFIIIRNEISENAFKFVIVILVSDTVDFVNTVSLQSNLNDVLVWFIFQGGQLDANVPVHLLFFDVFFFTGSFPKVMPKVFEEV